MEQHSFVNALHYLQRQHSAELRVHNINNVATHGINTMPLIN